MYDARCITGMVPALPRLTLYIQLLNVVTAPHPRYAGLYVHRHGAQQFFAKLLKSQDAGLLEVVPLSTISEFASQSMIAAVTKLCPFRHDVIHDCIGMFGHAAIQMQMRERAAAAGDELTSIRYLYVDVQSTLVVPPTCALLLPKFTPPFTLEDRKALKGRPPDATLERLSEVIEYLLATDTEVPVALPTAPHVCRSKTGPLPTEYCYVLGDVTLR